MLKNKRGVSEVVSVVLIIMITVAAIAVLWTIVIPMIKDGFSKGTACFDAQSDISLVDEGWTCIKKPTCSSTIFNASMNATHCYNGTAAYNNLIIPGELSVQVKKGADSEVVVQGLQIIAILPDGNSIKKIYNSTDVGLSGNTDRVYLISGNDSGKRWDTAIEVKIAPVIKVGKVEQTCDPTQRVALVECII